MATAIARVARTVPVLVFLLGAGPSRVAEAQPAQSAREAFERFKALAGRWEAATLDEQGKPVKAPVTYEVVSAGTTVLERIVEGKSDMVSAIHLDGDRLVLTHFCSAGNQPRMVARTFEGNAVRFEFLDATSLASPSAGHIHEAVFRFNDRNQVDSEWTYYESGKPGGTVIRRQTRR